MEQKPTANRPNPRSTTCAGTPFVLDGEYYENSFNLGCDFLVCQPLASTLSFSRTGVVAVDTDGAGGAGGAAGVAEYERYLRQPPFSFVNRYYADNNCQGELYEESGVIINDFSSLP